MALALGLRRLLKRSRSVLIVVTLAFVVLWSFLHRQSFVIDRYRRQFSSALPSNATTSHHVTVDRTTNATRSPPPPPPGVDSSDPNVTQVERRRRRKVTVELVGCARLGNHLFGHASMLGLADRHRLDPVISSASKLFLSTFDAGIPTEERASSGWKTCEEKLPSGYDVSVDEQLRMISSGGGGDVLLLGYFQSWRYFDHIRRRIVRHFRFKPATAERAAKVIESMTVKYSQLSNRSSLVVNGSRSDVVLVGVHVRRGDMIGPSALEKGYTVASPEYLKRAMVLMEDRCSSSSSSSSNGSVVVYVVVSDDIPWCRVHVTSQRFPVEYVSDNSADVDLAVLASCNHTILTVGSFGWWAAYLAGGLTVYYRDYPANGSQLSKGFRADDYFHPSWVGLS